MLIDESFEMLLNRLEALKIYYKVDALKTDFSNVIFDRTESLIEKFKQSKSENINNSMLNIIVVALNENIHILELVQNTKAN
jgi:hypothetical protein